MKIVLFCENKYSIDILNPLQEEARREGRHEVLWFVDNRKIPCFPLKDSVNWTDSMQAIYDFQPDAIFAPGNIVPYYLPGVKIEIFHGYAAEKKDHWIIRHYFDIYFTQGPYFTEHFERLATKYKDFEVLETGWTRQDLIFEHRSDFDEKRKDMLKKHDVKAIILYAPTFSPKLTSLPYLKNALANLVERRKVLLLIKLHPLTKQKWIEEYKKFASVHKNVVFIDDFSVVKWMLVSDVLISDTSSTIYEFLLLRKPVITFKTLSDDVYWKNINDEAQLIDAFDEVETSDDLKEKNAWIAKNYDPHFDGQCSKRMIEGAEDFIRRHGVPKYRQLNIWRKYMSIKKFGRIVRHISL